MKDFAPNHYERAFENWLRDNQIQYIVADEQKRATLADSRIKTFDFLLYPPNGRILIAEVKGRRFKGDSFAKLTGLECWVTTEDIDGLTGWQQVFGQDHQAIFVFAYKVDNVDVDFDGRDFYDYSHNRYVFFCVRLDDYCKYMKRRSPKWKTVTLPADKFRKCAVQMQAILI